MANFTGTFVKYTMETTTSAAVALSSYDRVTVNSPASTRINYINVNQRPTSGQIFPR